MVAKRGRHLIRAILFIVRLRNDVQNAHRRRTTRRRMGALAKTAAMLKQNGNDSKMKDRPPLTRCESSRRPRHELLRRQQQHRNSAPSTVYPAPRSPTPQPLNNYEEEEKEEGNNGEFESFVHMPLPYQQLQREIYPSKAHKYAVNSINGKTINLNEEEEFLENNKLEEEEEIKITGWLDSKELINLLEKIEIHKKGNEWQKLFPSTSITWDRNKRSKNGNINGGGGTAGLKQLFSAGAKLVKNIQRGLYLATIFYTDDGQILCTVDDCLPTICVDENCTTSNGLASEEFHWLMKLSFCWSQLKQLKNALLCCSTATANSSIRIRLLEAAVAMHNALGVKDIGKLYYIPLQPRPSTYILITVRLLLSKDVDVSLAAQGLALRWMRLGKFLIKKQNCSVMESLKFEILSILNFYESSLISLQPGLYLTYLRLQTSLNCINVLIPNNFTSILPFTKIRSNSYLTKQELDYLKLLSINQKEINSLSVEQINFHKELANAAKMVNFNFLKNSYGTFLLCRQCPQLFIRKSFEKINNVTLRIKSCGHCRHNRKLMNDLSLENPQISSTRIFFHRIVRLKKNVLLILAMPRPEEVCPIINLIKNKEDKNLNNSLNWANNNKNQFGNNGKCLSLPVSVFQIVNIFNYQPKLLCIYCQLSVFLDHFLMLSQYEQRANIDQNIAKEYSEQFLLLGQYQKLLEKCWQSTRWISDFASVARDKAFLNGRCWFPLPRIFNQPLKNEEEEINNKLIQLN